MRSDPTDGAALGAAIDWARAADLPAVAAAWAAMHTLITTPPRKDKP